MAGVDDSNLVPQEVAHAQPSTGLGSEDSTDPFEFAERPVQGIYWRFKRPLGFVLASLAAVLSSPVLLLIILVLSYRGRPILIRRRRLGRQGLPFDSYCFRTMVPDSLKGFGAGNEGVSVTDAFGRFLLRTRLDRAPLIWNVLKGDMNLVGPRPLSQEEFIGSGRAAWRTLSVRPGITGLWWLEGEPDLRRRLASDRTYIEHASPTMDLRIALRTLVMMHRGASSRPVAARVKAP